MSDRSYFVALIKRLTSGEITRQEFIAQCVVGGVPANVAHAVVKGLTKPKQ